MHKNRIQHVAVGFTNNNQTIAHLISTFDSYSIGAWFKEINN